MKQCNTDGPRLDGTPWAADFSGKLRPLGVRYIGDGGEVFYCTFSVYRALIES